MARRAAADRRPGTDSVTRGPAPPGRPSLPAALDRLIDRHYLEDSAAACRYVRALAAVILDELGFRGPGEAAPPSAIAERLGVVPERTYALAWLLREAAEIGAVAREEDRPGAPHYRPLAPPAPARRERAAAAMGDHLLGLGSSRPMFELVAGEYPAFLRGEKSGPYIVLRGRGLELWESYFSAANPLYDVHNRIGALGLAAALERLGRPARVIELGSGAGGGTAALLARLEEGDLPAPESFTLSDLAPSFLVRTVERLGGEGRELTRKRLDFDRPLGEQGIEPGAVDVMVGINALHNAADLAATLGRLAAVLAPDGLLVISESICGAAAHVHQDFVFNLLPPTRPVDPDAGAYSRFLSTAGWRRRLDAAPLAAEVFQNAHGPELALLALARPLAG